MIYVCGIISYRFIINTKWLKWTQEFHLLASKTLQCWCGHPTTDEDKMVTGVHMNVYNENRSSCITMEIQLKPLIMIALGPALFDNNNRLITLSRGYKNLHYLTQFIVTTFYMY
jgi:hypothetical protein